MTPRIVQIVAVVEEANDGKWTVFYGLAEDGSVWRGEPDWRGGAKWEGPVVLAPSSVEGL